jgi:hypothetical protein
MGCRRLSAIRQDALLQLSATILLQYYEYEMSLYVPLRSVEEWKYSSTFILDKGNWSAS